MNVTTMINPFIHKAIILFLQGLYTGIGLSAEKAAHTHEKKELT